NLLFGSGMRPTVPFAPDGPSSLHPSRPEVPPPSKEASLRSGAVAHEKGAQGLPGSVSAQRGPGPRTRGRLRARLPRLSPAPDVASLPLAGVSSGVSASQGARPTPLGSTRAALALCLAFSQAP